MRPSTFAPSTAETLEWFRSFSDGGRGAREREEKNAQTENGRAIQLLSPSYPSYGQLLLPDYGAVNGHYRLARRVMLHL